MEILIISMLKVVIYQKAGNDNQKFNITKNSDGSYVIKTKISSNKSAVEIANASIESGGNVQQYTINGHACQNWIFENGSTNLRAKNKKNELEKEIVKTEVYKTNDLVHTVVFVK